MSLRDRLGKEWLFCDGGTGSILQSWGLQPGEQPEWWNLKNKDRIIQLNQMYFEAGSDIVNANTFGANRLRFPEHLEEIVKAAVENARIARHNAGRDEDGYVTIDLGPTGKLLEPMGDLPFEEAVDVYKEVVRYGVEAGADLVLIETMTDSMETKSAVLAAKETCDLPVLVTVTFDEKGKLLTGGTPESMVAMLEGLGVDALGVNCSLGPVQMIPFIKRMVAASSLPIIVNPNAGLPKSVNGENVYDLGVDDYVSAMKEIATLGVSVLGGCCGTTPEYLKKMIQEVKPMPFIPPVKKHRTVVTSFSQAVEIGPKPVIIGERINPTGKKKFKAALKSHDLNYILSQGLDQEEAGAHILDVNVGLPGIDEAEMLYEVMTQLQSVLALPLQIDTGEPEAMEKALRAYNGKAMLNSVNGKQETMDAVFPIVAKYGAVVVALPLDEKGIPKTADERIAIAKKIYREAAKYGISQDDIVIDGLAMTVSSDPTSALTTLETIRRVRDELHGHSILGVSNISFGLPQRSILNSNFFTMAMQNGLSCAIVNPNSQAMMNSYRAYCALTHLDTNFTDYLSAYADVKTEPKVKKDTGPMSLYDAVKKGLSDGAAQAVREGLKTRDGLDLINEELVPALDEVGKGFEKGTLFLPQLLMSAEAAKAAFAVVKDSMSGESRVIHGKVIVATVKGDVHDIGKNIVKVMLENYGYEVIDLGKDVPPETVLQAAIDHDVKLVGLSALMTTTVGAMADTIKLLHEKKPGTKVIVGGAVLTQDYADEIGADAYGKDAMATVHYANKVFHVEEE